LDLCTEYRAGKRKVTWESVDPTFLLRSWYNAHCSTVTGACDEEESKDFQKDRSYFFGYVFFDQFLLTKLMVF